jgi:hypothetical protein
LSEIVHAGRSLEILKSEVENSSDLPTLLYIAKNGRLRERKKALTIIARKRGIPNAIISAILHSSRKTERYHESNDLGLCKIKRYSLNDGFA